MIFILCIACANVTTIESDSSASENGLSDKKFEKESDKDKIMIGSEKEMSESGSSTGEKSKKKGILGVAEDFVKDPTTVDEDFRERWRPKRPATARDIKEIEERAKVSLN